MSIGNVASVNPLGGMTPADRFRTVVGHLDIAPDEMAAAFHACGIRGSLAPDLICPLASYVANVCGHDVATTETDIYLLVSASVRLSLPLPEPARTFIARFDAGQYPELVR